MTLFNQNTQQNFTPTEPALLLTVQNTLPVLTTLLFTLSLAMIGFIGTAEKWLYFDLPTGGSSKDLALWLLSASAFLFLLTATCCVKAHAWDYYSITLERRKEEGLSSEGRYKNRCWTYSWLWHKVAIWSYTFGVFALLLGVAILFWKMSRATSVLSLISIVISLLPKLVDMWFSKNLHRQEKRQRILKRVLKDEYREF
jgi:hypothetical protein